jgi:hypothetical protein
MHAKHFVIGIWRSGTSLLREVLGMSEEVKIFPEHFVLLNHLHKASHFTSSVKEEMLEKIVSNPDFVHFARPNIKQLRTDFKQASSFEEAIQLAYSSCLSEKETPSVFLDKNPIYSYYLEELLSLFPKSRFIWMLREPKDNCISRRKYKIQSLPFYAYQASWWNRSNELIAQQALKYPDRFLLVHYDEMVLNPEYHIKQICNFLEIGFKADMLRFEEKKEQRTTDFVVAAKARDGKLSEKYIRKKTAMWENLQQPINTSKTKQWKQEMTKRQIASVDSICNDFYEHLLQGNYAFKPQYPIIWKNLVNLSLAKLKWDIKRGVKH